MPARQYKTDPVQLLAEGKRIVHSTTDAKYQHKVEMVNLVLSGLTPSYLSNYCGDSKSTITRWVKIADEQGFDALKPKKPTGKPAKLAKEQMTEIRTVLEEDEPKKYGYNVWDGPSLSAFIEKTYAVELSVRQCQRLFHRLGFSLVRPQTFPSKGEQNEQERTEYKKNFRSFNLMILRSLSIRMKHIFR